MYTLKAEKRDEGLKAKQLRKAGKIPACIYSADHKGSILIQLAQNDVQKLAKGKTEGALISLELAESKHAVLLKEVSRSAVDRKIEDISFQELVADTPVKSTATLVMENAALAAGTSEQIVFELPYKALPAKLVETVAVDMTGKKPGEGVHVADLPFAKEEGVEVLIAMDTVVAHVRDSAKLAAAAAAEVAAAAPAADNTPTAPVAKAPAADADTAKAAK